MTHTYGDMIEKVIAVFDKNPDLTSIQIGERLGVHPAYVRQILTQNDRKLKGARQQ